MSDNSMSVFLATTILALGGLGLYVYKTSKGDGEEDDNEYDEIKLFGEDGLSSFFSWGTEDENTEDEKPEDKNTKDEESEEPRKKKTSQNKTHRYRKPISSSRRRF